MKLVLDAEPLSRLSMGGTAAVSTAEVLEAARRLDRDVIVSAGTLAELYRGRARAASVDSTLARSGIDVRDTDRRLVRLIGALLHDAQMDSVHLADAHVAAVAVESGRSVVLTGDADDLERLLGGHPGVTVATLDGVTG